MIKINIVQVIQKTKKYRAPIQIIITVNKEEMKRKVNHVLVVKAIEEILGINVQFLVKEEEVIIIQAITGIQGDIVIIIAITIRLATIEKTLIKMRKIKETMLKDVVLLEGDNQM